MTINGRPIGFDDTVAQPANTFLAGPTSGGNAAPTMRLLVVADIPAYIKAGETLQLTTVSL